MPEQPMTYDPDALRGHYNVLAGCVMAHLQGTWPADPFEAARRTLQVQQSMDYVRGFIAGAADAMDNPPAQPKPKKPPEDDCGCPDPKKTPPPAGPQAATATISPEVEPMAVSANPKQPGVTAGSVK